MERNANFIFVGVIALFGLISLGIFAFWLGKYGSNEDQFQSYRTYVSESVAGLKGSSPVRLKGIDVGFVEEVRIDGENPERILIDFKVEKNTPIKTDSVIVLNSQGIAGIGYLEIKGGTNGSPFLSAVDKSERPVLISKPSMISVMTDKAELILSHIDKTVLKIDQLVSERNIQNTTTSLENLSLISTELKNNRQDMTTLLKGAIEVESNTNQTIKAFSSLAQKSDSVLEETKTLAQESTSFVREIKQSDPMGKLNVTLENSNQAIEEGKNMIREGTILIKSLQESPSDLLFKSKSSVSIPENER
ncbi:MlaD family protein [Sulfuricurvum sp.]|uniref:MlaD family protein n=1 Tax=Sulfuricurvum sp. TaxID=2025608 RepID=UPI003BB7FE79